VSFQEVPDEVEPVGEHASEELEDTPEDTPEEEAAPALAADGGGWFDNFDRDGPARGEDGGEDDRSVEEAAPVGELEGAPVEEADTDSSSEEASPSEEAPSSEDASPSVDSAAPPSEDPLSLLSEEASPAESGAGGFFGSFSGGPAPEAEIEAGATVAELEAAATARESLRMQEMEAREEMELRREERMRERNQRMAMRERNQRLREEQTKERQEQTVTKVHAKARSDMIIKYFSERVAPGIHDVAGKIGSNVGEPMR
jgi:hypothetical protein